MCVVLKTVLGTETEPSNFEPLWKKGSISMTWMPVLDADCRKMIAFPMNILLANVFVPNNCLILPNLLLSAEFCSGL